MTASQLLGHYERIMDAPDAIARVRQFILDLAMRGKLVPQDARDEPASKLLKRIAAEKERLLKVGKIKIALPVDAVGIAEVAFALPPTWAWTRIGEIFDYDAGKKRDPKELLQDRWLLELARISRMNH